MKYQSKKQEIRRVSGSARALAASALVLLMASLLVGCSVTSSRVITATHWGVQQDQVSGSARAAVPAPVVEAEGANAEGVDAEGAPADDAEQASAALEATAPVATPSSSATRSDMTLYIGYTEATSAQTVMDSGDTPLGLTSHVRFCNLKPDASLVCNESPELNKMLNPHINE